MAKKKFYVVWEGNTPGIYDNWSDCQAQIKNYPNAKYKSFKTEKEAKEAYSGAAWDHIGKNPKQPKQPHQMSEAARAEINWESIAVDAACSGNPGVMEYRGVDTKSGIEFFRQGPFNKSTNNIGEFLALVHALAMLQQKGLCDMPVYSDSKTAMAWVRKKRVNTSLQRNAVNEDSFQLVDRAVTWLQNNEYENPILKWKTEEWGEIPADFGRK